VRNKNVRLAQGEKCLGSLALQVANYAFGHVLNIERTLSQVRIVDLIQCFGVTGGDFLKNPLDIAKICASKMAASFAPMDSAMRCCISRICMRV
jgi:hypothetical protein